MTVIVEDERRIESPLVEKVWHMQTENADGFISQANSHSEIVFTWVDGQMMVTVRGPETCATPVPSIPDGEFLGIVFKLGTFMPHLLPQNLTDLRDADLPLARDGSFWLASDVWEAPTFDNVDVFVRRLVRAGLLRHDPVVVEALQGHTPTLSPRALQYRFKRATGLSHKVIQQIDRAEKANDLLRDGLPIADVAYTLGYTDQSHLTNALRRFLGQTPGQIARMHEAG